MAAKKQARKAPARKSVTRVAWLVVNTEHGVPECAYKSSERGYALSDWKETLDSGAHILVRVTYTLPRRTKR